ncbi:MAG: sulfite exporter TauE/SafE family protein [Pseudomonadota bacterium]
MTDLFAVEVIFEIGVPTLVVIMLLSVVTSAIHGATGVAGGFLLAAALAPLIGVKPVVPVMSVALLISHSTRALLNLPEVNWTVFFTICLTGVPCLLAVAFLYGDLSSTFIAVFLGCVILVSIPIRRWAKARSVRARKRHLAGIGAVYGGFSGASIGPGMLLLPFMLGYGLTKEAFVATLAMIALVTNVIRVGVFGSTDLLGNGYLALGLLVGLMTIPGNWIGRTLLRRMTNERHADYLDILTVLGAINFFWLAWHS